MPLARAVGTNGCCLFEQSSATPNRCQVVLTALGAVAMCGRTSKSWRRSHWKLISVYPNVGCPIRCRKPATTKRLAMTGFPRNSRKAGLVNIAGGCGTTPAHIRSIAEAVAKVSPRSALAGWICADRRRVFRPACKYRGVIGHGVLLSKRYPPWAARACFDFSVLGTNESFGRNL